jgi:metal-sulfur cluster biosynthetic enzyme
MSADAAARGEADGADGADPAVEGEGEEAWPAPPGRVPETAEGLEETVWEACDDVLDLHVPVSLVDMGMIYGVEADEGTGEATVQMTFPCMGCPGYEMLQGDVRNRVGSVPAVEAATVEVVWDPIWTKDRLTAEAREQLEDCGIGI